MKSADLLDLTRQLAERALAPRVTEAEATETFPAEVFKIIGAAGLLGLPYPESLGGGGQPYEVYLQVLEELAMRWAAVAVAVSVHGLSCFPLATFGTPEQQERWLPDLLGGGMLGAYSLSEPQAGSDAAALACQAERDGDEYVITGTKAWITSAGKADSYTLFARTAPGRQCVSCFLVPAGLPGLSFGEPREEMGLRGVPTASAHYDGLRLPADRRIGAEGQGLRIAFSALDSGRLGIAAIAVGLAQAALDYAVGYARERRTFGRRIIEHEGLAFLLADMAAAVHSARATYLDAARRRDAGRPYSEQASVAKLVATDAAMKVTTDAVQVLGGYGYSQEFPVERYLREAKIMQIFEGTNQIQRLVISRHLASEARAGVLRGRRNQAFQSASTAAVSPPGTGGADGVPAGVREKRGAGAACGIPSSVITDSRAVMCGARAASAKDRTGVTHASVPAKISAHSSRLRLAITSVKRARSRGQPERSICSGRSSPARPSPARNCA